MDRGDVPGREALPAPGPDAELKLSVTPWGSFISRVPADQAHHLITTFGIMVSAVAGTVGAVLVFHATRDALPVYAMLGLALVAAVLVAVCGRLETRKKRERAELPGRARAAAQDGEGPIVLENPPGQA
jgi:hypothetical protein